LLPQIGIHLGKELSRQSSTPEEPTIVAVDIPIGLPAPETGAALVSGQWRTFKTTVALDVSVCVMADLLFAGRYRVKRRRAVLYISRLRAKACWQPACRQLPDIVVFPGHCRLLGVAIVQH